GSLIGGVGPQSPTTLSSATGQVQGSSKKSFIIAGVAVVGLAVGGIALVVAKGGGSKPADPGPGSDTQGSSDVATAGSATGAHGGAVRPPPPPPPAVDAAVAVATGSAGSGSAAVIPPPPVTNASLQLTSVPDGAEIFLDGVDTGKTTTATITVAKAKK